jgi:hypothetical protein
MGRGVIIVTGERASLESPGELRDVELGMTDDPSEFAVKSESREGGKKERRHDK